MSTHESFGECLQRILTQAQMSASEAARLVGFRSRNSIFRILADDTSCDVDSRFLSALRQAIGDKWPQSHWDALETALYIKRVGLTQYLSDQAFRQAMHDTLQAAEFTVVTRLHGDEEQLPLSALLAELSAKSTLDIIMCGCCQKELATALLDGLDRAGGHGRVTLRHFIDIREDRMVQNILGVMPLLSRVWYNARLVEEDRCPPEMAALYRVSILCIRQHRDDGESIWHELVKYDGSHFVHIVSTGAFSPVGRILDQHRFQLELLKPLSRPGSGAAAFIDYTAQYAELERDCMILSIKPDVHFNCIPSRILYPAILDGFRQSGYASGPELTELMEQLEKIHDARFENMCSKHRPTHLVYSIPAMEQFMRTGVLSDQFFIQRAYTPQERREILQILHQCAENNPFFNIHFLRPEADELRSEIGLYENKGVLLLDAYTGYDLHEDHSEALITLPVFMESFQRFFMDCILAHHVLPQAESLAVLKRLYTDTEL